MAHVLVHTIAISDLASEPDRLSPALAAALAEDLEYARFGAVLPDLPYFERPIASAVSRLAGRAPLRPPQATLFHNGAPVGLGLRLCELVGSASMVGRTPGLAVVAGYFSHLAVDRVLCPPVQRLEQEIAAPGEAGRSAEEIEFGQAMRLAAERLGPDVVGHPEVRAHLQVLKRRRFPVRGVGRGLHLLVETACADVLGVSPTARELDRWVQGLWLYARVLASPRGRQLMGSGDEAQGDRAYRSEGFDYPRLYSEALDRSREYAHQALDYLSEGNFDRSAREAFLTRIPEGSIL